MSGVASTGFTVTYSGAAAGVDVANLQLVGLACGGCFASVEETNHGGANDSFTLTYDGNTTVPIVNGVNYTAAGITAALAPILPAGATAAVQAFGGGATINNQGFWVTFAGTLAATNVPVMLQLTNPSAGLTGFVNEVDKGGAVDNKGGTITPTGNTWPSVTVPTEFTIPLRTPFALTGSATDAEGDPMTFIWEQNDRGGTAGHVAPLEHEDERSALRDVPERRDRSARRTRSSTTRRARTTSAPTRRGSSRTSSR